MIKVISPIKSDEPIVRYEKTGFLRWYDEVFREGYKRKNDSITLEDAVLHLQSLNYKVTVEHKYLVTRTNNFGIVIAMLVTAETTIGITTDEELVDEIRSTVTGLVRKDSDFRKIYEYAGTDMNIGDLVGYEEIISENSFNIISLDFEDICPADFWNYDTSLCGDIDEDNYESGS